MKRILVLAAMVTAMIVNESSADVVVSYNFSGASGDEQFWSATSSSPLTTPSALSRGIGLTPSGAANSFSSSAWTTGNTIDANDYYEFSVTSQVNTLMDLNFLSFAERRSGTGIRNFELRSSLDGFTTFSTQAIISVPDDTATRDQSINLNGLTGLSGGTVVSFRLYGYAAEQGAGTWRIANHSTDGGLYLDGTVTAIPEPSAFFLVGSILGSCLLRRRRA